jgi:ubiquinol-cytochrome c reductase cytochrome c1 subunit
MRWNRLMELGLTESQIKDNLMFSGDKVGELMSVAMIRKDAQQWFGAAPPDLSVIARARGADWLYSYLRGFYRDAAPPDRLEQHGVRERRHAESDVAAAG